MTGAQTLRCVLLSLSSVILSDIISPVHCRLVASVAPVISDSLTLESTRRKLQYGYGGYYGYGYGRYGYMPGWGIAVVVVIVVLILLSLCCSCFLRRRALKRYQDGNGPAPMFNRGEQYPPNQVMVEGYPATQQGYPVNPQGYPANQQYPDQQYANQRYPNP